MAFRIYKYPFLILTLSLAIGILIAFERLTAGFSALLLLFAILAYLFSMGKRGFAPFIGTFMLFAATGALSIALQTWTGSGKNFETNYLPGDALKLKVLSVSTPKENKWQKVIAEVNQTISGEELRNVNGKLLLFCSPEMPIRPQEGDIVFINSELHKIENLNNPGEFDAEWYWRTKNIRYMSFVSDWQLLGNEISYFNATMEKIRSYFRFVLSKFLSGEENQVAHALIIGDRNLLERETTAAFSNSGIMHLLAVSGLHVGIFYALLIYFFQLFRNKISRYHAIGIALIIIWIYAFLTGLSASVLRAVIMFTIIGISELSGKNNSNINTLFFAGFLILVVDPLSLFDIGFQLSFMAILSIYLFNPIVGSLLNFKNPVLKFLWMGTAVGVSAQVLTIPFTLYYFHQFPNYFILSNIVVLILGGVVLGAGIVLLILAKIPFVNKLAALVLFSSLYVVIQTGHLTNSIPGSVGRGFSFSYLLIPLILVLILAWRFAGNKIKNRWAAALGLLIIFSSLHFGRVGRMYDHNITFYNENFPCFSLKIRDELLFFYAGGDSQRKKAEFLATAYQSIYPAEINFLPLESLKNIEIRKGKMHCQIKNRNEAVEINIGDSFYSLNTKQKNLSIFKSLKQRNIDLSKGAFKTAI